MTLRDATPADAPAIAAILNESVAAQDSLMIEEPVGAEAIEAQMETMADGEGYLVLEDDGTVVGWGILKRYSERSGYRFTAETSVYLQRDQRGRGYGSRIQEALLERARENGFHHLVAKIWADNDPSIALHRKFGYEIVGTQREVGFVGGRWRDVTIMQRVL